jgi:DNA topoisomerase IA
VVTDPPAARGSLRHAPGEGGNKAAKLKAIREALRTAKRVWLATDCDREGQLIGQRCCFLVSVPVTVSTICRISFVCAQARIEAE